MMNTFVLKELWVGCWNQQSWYIVAHDWYLRSFSVIKQNDDAKQRENVLMLG